MIPTKRSLLQIAAKVFDPLGCISLFTINRKALFQDLCVAKVAWDEPLEGDYLKQYKDLISRMGDLKEIQLKSGLFPKGEKVSKIELHAFSDASECSYAAVIYLRIVYESGDIKIHFVASKALAKRCQHLSQQMPTLLGIVGHCWTWGGQTNPTLVPNIYLLITPTPALIWGPAY